MLMDIQRAKLWQVCADSFLVAASQLMSFLKASLLLLSEFSRVLKLI